MQGNLGSVQSHAVLWDGYKATLRGEIISLSFHQINLFCREEQRLEKQISKLEAAHVSNPTLGDTLRELLRRRFKFNKRVSAQSQTAHLRDSAVLFGDSNWACRVLATYLCTNSQRSRITNM